MTDDNADRIATALESIASSLEYISTSLNAPAPGSNGQNVTIVGAVGELTMQLIDISKAINNIPSKDDEG